MVSDEFQCYSRESKDWLLATFGDKGRALLHHIDAIVDYCKKEQIPIEFFVKSKAKVFTDQMAEEVKALMKRESRHLDSEMNIWSRCTKQEASRAATGIVKDLTLLCLQKAEFIKPSGVPMTRSAFCGMLSMRRPDKTRFLNEQDVYGFYEMIGDCSSAEANKKIIEAYSRIKKSISEL